MAVPSEKFISQPAQIHAATAGYEDILTPGRPRLPGQVASAGGTKAPAAASCPRQRQARYDGRRAAGFPGGHQGDPRIELDGGADPGRSAGPPRGDHRPGRAQDDHQRAELRREGVHGRLRRFIRAELRQSARRPDQPARRRERHAGLPLARGQGLSRRRQPPPCSSYARAAGICRNAT